MDIQGRWGPSMRVLNRHRRARERPEPACVLAPRVAGWHTQVEKDVINVLPWYRLVGVASTSRQKAHQLGERRPGFLARVSGRHVVRGTTVLTCPLPNSQLLSAAVRRVRHGQNSGDGAARSILDKMSGFLGHIQGLGELMPDLEWRPGENLAAASPSTGSPAGRAPLNGDGSMCSQAYVRTRCEVCALPSSSVAARDRGHWKGAVGSGVGPVRRAEAVAKMLRRVERWTPRGALGCRQDAVQEPEDHKRQSYLCKTKTSQETERSLRKFLEPSEKAEVNLR